MTNNANKAKGEYDSWEAAAHEYESENRDKGLWAELYAKNKGDEKRTKADYIRQRADALTIGGTARDLTLESSLVERGEWISEQMKIAKIYYTKRGDSSANEAMATAMFRELSKHGCKEADILLLSLQK